MTAAIEMHLASLKYHSEFVDRNNAICHYKLCSFIACWDAVMQHVMGQFVGYVIEINKGSYYNRLQHL